MGTRCTTPSETTSMYVACSNPSSTISSCRQRRGNHPPVTSTRPTRAYHHWMRLRSYRRPILVNDYEVAVDSQLGRLCERYAARLFAKVGMKDVLPIQGSGLDNEDYRYALMAHFDFVIAHQGGEAMLAVEFDGGRHRTDPQQIIRDDRKNRICDKFLLPLVRAGASSLQRADHRTLLEWLIELFFEQRRLWAQHEAYEEGGDVDPPDYDPREFNYREAWKPFDRGLETAGLLDAFGEA